MKFLLSVVLCTSLFIVNNVEALYQPTVGTTWNYVLQDGSHINVSSESAQVIDLDINNDAKINELRKAGKKVICYFSGGTIETNRDDYDEYFKVDGLVRNRYEEWPKERWLDFRKEGIKPLIKNRMKKAVSKNCDGIEVDNLGAYLHDEVKSWSDPITEADTIEFAKWLGSTAHSLGISIGLKNVLGIIDRVGDYFDFAINESCILYNECHLYKNFLNKGKAVFAVTYGGVSSHKDALCRNLDGLGISMIVKSGDDLVQDGVVFDGKKYCGSGFKGVRVGSSSSGSSSGSTSGSTSGSSSGSSSGSTRGSVGGTTNGLSVGSNVQSSNNNIVNNNKPVVVNKTTVKPIGNSTKQITTKVPVNGAVATSSKNSSPTTVQKEAPANKPNVDGVINDELNDDDSKSKKNFVTGIAITGSILGAAGALLLFKKKNPKKYEEIKRSLTKNAKFNKNKPRSPVISKPTMTNNDYYYSNYDINDESLYQFNNYRYQFTKNFDY